MFKKELFQEIGRDIYVYKNFATKEECDIILSEAESLPEDDWWLIGEHGRYLSKKHIPQLKFVRDRMLDLLEDGSHLGPSEKSLRMVKNSWSAPHADNFEFLDVLAAMDKYVEGDDFDLCDNNYYGTVFYFNDFEGGELEYVNQGITYKPEPGDLVIHSAGVHCSHAVKKILEQTRYSFANHIFGYVKVPKGFTREYGL